MQVHTDIEALPLFRRAVATIGTFDGVHLGHQRIITGMKEEAARVGGETVIISFHPHPRKVVDTDDQGIRLLTTIEERTALLSAMGVDHMVIVPFTRSFSEMSPREYIEHFLMARIHPATVIIGYDHRFGKGRTGDYRLLEDYCSRGSFGLREIPRQLLDDVTVSSTLIRNALLSGNIDKANSLLGYDFSFEGRVQHGDHRGRTLGFPTANLCPLSAEKIIPGNGVYIVEVEVVRPGPLTPAAGERPLLMKGMMNIGTRPTVDGRTRTIEVHLLDFSGDLYDATLKVFVRSFLREEKRFGGLEELKQQLEEDRRQAMAFFNR